jgi:hypothetical protein
VSRIAAFAFVALSVAGAPASAADIACVNPASGARWQIHIDYVHRTVDSFPATIAPSEISWRDDKANSNYTLDRRSGDLTVITPSSTGGYFLHHRCKPDKPN